MLDFFRVVPKKRVVKIKKAGLLYHNPSFGKKVLFHVGTGIFLFGIAYFIYLYYPLAEAVFRYRTHTIEVEREIAINDPHYYLSIPKIGAFSEVMLDVNPYDETIYLPILDQNLVAHALGTDLPNQGKGKATYIFAHSSQQGINRVRNNSVFYLLNDLKNGDIVYIKNADKAYLYIVYDKKIVGAKEIDKITFRDPEKEILILQTCWPIGTDWKRLLVYATRP